MTSDPSKVLVPNNENPKVKIYKPIVPRVEEMKLAHAKTDNSTEENAIPLHSASSLLFPLCYLQ